MSTLKPCPFCQSKLVALYIQETIVAVGCIACHARGPDVHLSTAPKVGESVAAADKATALWNARGAT